MTPSAPPRTPPSAPPKQPARSQPAASSGAVSFGPPESRKGHRVAIYGPGGIGKTSLAAMAPGPVVFFDLDDSLSRLNGKVPESVRVVSGHYDWDALRTALNSPGWDDVATLVIDSATRAEELCAEWVIANVPHEKGNRIRRLEDYGYGKGYQHVYETFLLLLADLDRHAHQGRHIILVCHDCTANVPNPTGDDYIRYEPRLQMSGSGKSAIRLRVREFVDHLFFVGYDLDVNEGKARGCGSRTIYPTEQSFCMAKSRTLAAPMVYGQGDASLWSELFGPNTSDD